MITLYLEQTPSLIDEMKKGTNDKNWTVVQAAAHKMIPSFSIMGMHVDYENLTKKIQDFAKEQQRTEEIHELVLELENVCSKACSELEEEFNKLKV